MSLARKHVATIVNCRSDASEACLHEGISVQTSSAEEMGTGRPCALLHLSFHNGMAFVCAEWTSWITNLFDAHAGNDRPTVKKPMYAVK